MESKETVHQAVAKLSLEEHEKLHNTLDQVRAVAEEARISHSEQGLQKLLDLLKDFLVVMRTHMEFEEADGFLKPVLEIRPTLSIQVEQIRSEHDKVLQTIQELIRAFESPHHSTFWPRDVPEATLELIEEIDNHEERENTMVLEVFCHDVGTKD
jgi:hypothetical protein